MISKLELIIVFVLTALGLLMLWNNFSLDRLRKIIKDGKNQLPDDKYFELKYKNQYLTFAGVLLLAFIGALGYNTFQDIQSDLKYDLDTVSLRYNEKLDKMSIQYDNEIDSLINIRIDNTNKKFSVAYSDLYSDLNKNYSDLFNEVNSARNEVNGYSSKLKEITDRLGYSKMFVINEIKLSNIERPSKVIMFKKLGINDLKSVPTVFITQKNDFDFKIVEITKESVNIDISNAKQDTLNLSMLLFLK